MAPEVQAVVQATQVWLQSSWHVQVPFAWLQACVGWLQEEAGEEARVSQQQINQQVLDQWLLTDLRDLDHPVLPEGLAQAQKTELSGTFCVQVDSLLDVSQPAYGQLQRWRGTDCSNDEVSAVTQTTQRPWETRPTRMLLLQVTDGVQSLEAMEYQVIPTLSADLRPGAKLQLQGKMVCRLGVLLLGPTNVKVLGGEVEDLVERNSKGRVLCRTLGLPEEQQQEEEQDAQAPQQDNREGDDMGLDDAELLASLEAEREAEMLQGGPTSDSGYGTLAVTSTSSPRSSPSVRSFVSTISARSETPTGSHRSGLMQSSRGGSVPRHHSEDEQEVSDMVYQEALDERMAEEDFPDEDFDFLPLDELDNVMFEEDARTQADSSHGNSPVTTSTETQRPGSTHKTTKPQTAPCQPNCSSGSEPASRNSRTPTVKRDFHGYPKVASGHSTAAVYKPFIRPSSPHQQEVVDITDDDCMDEDMDCFFVEAQDFGEKPETALQPPAQQGPSKVTDSRPSMKSSSSMKTGPSLLSSGDTPQRQTPPSISKDQQPPGLESQFESTVPALTLTSTPFTYLCVLEKSPPKRHATDIRVKAFIVTLLGKLSSSNGVWSVSATVSDGTGYLDVELSDAVLTKLLGFSVPEKVVLRRDPARRSELEAGMRRCQEELVDMCCIMTIWVKPDGGRAVVTKAEPVDEKVLHELEQRARERK